MQYNHAFDTVPWERDVPFLGCLHDDGQTLVAIFAQLEYSREYRMAFMASAGSMPELQRYCRVSHCKIFPPAYLWKIQGFIWPKTIWRSHLSLRKAREPAQGQQLQWSIRCLRPRQGSSAPATFRAPAAGLRCWAPRSTSPRAAQYARRLPLPFLILPRP